jgi:hypothetical protein
MNPLGLRAVIAAASIAFGLLPTGSAGAVLPVPAAAFAPVNVPGTAPLGASPEDLSKYGYVEQEYYVSGSASRYRMPTALGDAQLVDSGHRYKTRMLVRRPADPSKFNGTVAVEWYNVTAGQDIDFNYAASHEYLLRNGYAIVAVSVQTAGIITLKAWSPARYGDLSVNAPLLDAAPAAAGAGGAGFRTDDILHWDIFSQTIKGLRQPGAVNPLPGMTVKRVIANGESQSAGLLTRYYNSIDPLHRLVDGMVFYDGAGQLRTDSPTKAITVATEVFGANPGTPQEDNANFRRFDVAGASHIGLYDARYADAITARDGALKLPDGTKSSLTGLITGCAWTPIWSSVPVHYVVSAAFDHMNKWIQGVATPPSAPRYQRDTSVTPAVVRRDTNGTVLGGIRLAEIEYPTALNRGGGNTGANFFCFITGSHQPYTAEELAARYPDPRAYLRNVEALTARNVAQGFILAPEAANSVANARNAFAGRAPSR